MGQTATFNVQGMSCQHCKAAVEKAVRTVHGVTGVQVDLSGGIVRAQVDSAGVVPAIEAAIDRAGYTVTDRRIG